MMQTQRKPDLPPPVLVTENTQLAPLVTQLLSQPAIAVDTESNSLYAYQERVCLIQFSIPDADFLVDPLSGLDLDPLGEVFANHDVVKVFHAAEYDVMCMRRDFGWIFRRLFDTMWAARVLGWPRTGLGNILEEQFGVRLDKRWQRYDWARRPLSPEALAYARLDTHYLLPLRQRMLAELQDKGRMEEAREFFAEVAQAEPAFKPFDPDSDLWRVKGVWDMAADDRAVLRELLIWRDAAARRRDQPPFKILHDQTLVTLAEARPHSFEELGRIQGIKRYHLRRYGRRILEAIVRGAAALIPEPPPRPSRPPDEVLARYEALRHWRKKRASQQGVDPDVVVSNAALWTLAQHAPRSLGQLANLGAIGPWKQKTYGEALLAVLHDHRGRRSPTS